MLHAALYVALLSQVVLTSARPPTQLGWSRARSGAVIIYTAQYIGLLGFSYEGLALHYIFCRNTIVIDKVVA